MNNVGWPWYISILLWFKRASIGVDIDDGIETKCYMKHLFGKHYVVKLTTTKVKQV